MKMINSKKGVSRTGTNNRADKEDRGTSILDMNDNPEATDVKVTSERDFRHSRVKQVLII